MRHLLAAYDRSDVAVIVTFAVLLVLVTLTERLVASRRAR